MIYEGSIFIYVWVDILIFKFIDIYAIPTFQYYINI